MNSVIAGIALSLHLGLDGSYNQIHPYVRMQNENNIIAGAYYNSENRVSGYLGYELEVTEKVSVDLGIVSGYSSQDILPMARVTYDDKIFIAPAIEYSNEEVDKFGVVIGIQF